MQRRFAEPGLYINHPSDQYEREADAMANRIVSNEFKPDYLTHPSGLIGNSIQKKCASCEEEDKKKAVMRKTESNGSNTQTSPSFFSYLSSSKGSGSPIQGSAKHFMEKAFSTGFSSVRIHTDSKASEMSNEISARAFTYGNDIYFNRSEFRPQSNEGRKLLAHELTHVVQQQGVKKSQKIYRQPLPGFKIEPSPRMARLIGSEELAAFKLESYTLSEDHKSRLDIFSHTLLNLVEKYPNGVIKITGHTDATGTEGFNDNLGDQRARAVMNYLIELGVPENLFIISSEGEKDLRIKTSVAEGENRRVEIRFVMSPMKSSLPASELKRPSTFVPPRKVDLKYVPKADYSGPDCSANITDCYASPISDFSEQPVGLRNLIKHSFTDRSESQWFTELDSDKRGALTSIYNRFCKYGLTCYLRTVSDIKPGEAIAEMPFVGLAGLRFGFKVPGKTASVYFTASSGTGLLEKLKSTGNFCVDGPVSGALHQGSTSLREISKSDSLHASISGNSIEAHIDKFAPIQTHPGGLFCPGAPTPEAIGHIGKEVFPEFFRKFFGIPGVQVFPDPIGRPGLSPDSDRTQLPPSLVGITLYGPVTIPPKRRSPAVIFLPDDLESELAGKVPEIIAKDLLIPKSVRLALLAATKAADIAGPDEESALIKAKEAAQAKLNTFVEDAREVALDMARKMVRAKSAGKSGFVVELGENYEQLDSAERKLMQDQIIHIARLVRGLLGDRAGGIYQIWIIFGQTMQDFKF